MCAASRGHATALARVPAAQLSSYRPAACGNPAWWAAGGCWVIVALEPHSSALRMCDCGGATEVTVRPADLEALHLRALSGDRGTAL